MPAVDRRLIQNFEWPLFGLTVGLALIGVINLVSAAPETDSWFPATSKRQLSWLGIGLIAMLVALIPDYRSLQRFALPFYAIGVLSLIAVLYVGTTVNGSTRWIVMGPVRIQPAEFMKLAVILLFARLLARRDTGLPTGLATLLVPALLVAVPAALILKEPDLGTAMLIALVAGTYVLVANIPPRILVGLALSGLIGMSGAWFFYLHDYQKQRVLTFLDPERDPLGAAYHAIQSQIAVGSGGLFGRGFREGSQSQLEFLPEQQTDFVFSVLAEEWGFVGAMLVLLLYLGMLVRTLMIARASKDLFGAYLSLGICGLFFWAALINVGMVVGLAPVVGIPLPFLSYGGSSLLTCLLGAGIVMNISMRRYVF